MKKILWFLFAFVLAAILGNVVTNAWESARFFQEKGRDTSLKVGRKYNASRWAAPVPLAKIHSYVAIMAPDHEVLIESDQDLTENKEYFIRFLYRDDAVAARSNSVLPLIGAIRLKTDTDGAPVKLAKTDVFDRAVEKAMGPLGDDVYVAPKAVAEAAPTTAIPTVPFVFAGATDSTAEIVWNNASTGQLTVGALWLLIIQMVVLHAWVTPFDPKRPTGVERKDFVHPSMRRVDATPLAAPSAKLAYKAKPPEPDFIPADKPAKKPVSASSSGSEFMPAPSASRPPSFAPPPKRATIALPPSASSPSIPRPPEAPYSTATTAPFAPAAAGEAEPTLKLTRKPKPAPSATTSPLPPPESSSPTRDQA